VDAEEGRPGGVHAGQLKSDEAGQQPTFGRAAGLVVADADDAQLGQLRHKVVRELRLLPLLVRGRRDPALQPRPQVGQHPLVLQVEHLLVAVQVTGQDRQDVRPEDVLGARGGAGHVRRGLLRHGSRSLRPLAGRLPRPSPLTATSRVVRTELRRGPCHPRSQPPARRHLKVKGRRRRVAATLQGGSKTSRSAALLGVLICRGPRSCAGCCAQASRRCTGLLRRPDPPWRDPAFRPSP